MFLKQLKALFSGTVQGVGFRFTVNRIARQFEITGYVRNLPNGKVELLAEGEEETLEDFLQAIFDSEMGRFIQDSEVAWSLAEGRFETFCIRT